MSLSVQHEDHGAPRVWSGRPGNGSSLRPLRVEKQFIFSDQVEPHPAQSLLNILALSHLSSHACAILNGISGVTIMAAPPLISSHWFPPEERTTATSINQAANMLGNGLSMLVGPALVPWQNDTTVS